ncbi:unnamed protein product [Calypogeia fissa]
MDYLWWYFFGCKRRIGSRGGGGGGGSNGVEEELIEEGMKTMRIVRQEDEETTRQRDGRGTTPLANAARLSSSHSGVATQSIKENRGRWGLPVGPGGCGLDGQPHPQTFPRTSSGVAYKSDIISRNSMTLKSSSAEALADGPDGQGAADNRGRWLKEPRSSSRLELPGDDGGDRAFSMQLLNHGNLEGDDGKAQPPPSPCPFHGVTKEKLELRSQIVRGIVQTILNLQDATLVGNMLTSWLKKFVSRVDIISTLENLSGQADRSNGNYPTSRFVPYSQIARIVHSVMQDLGRMRHLQAALEVLRWMQRQGWCQLDPHMYTTIISALGEAGSFELAEKVFQGLENSQVEKDQALLNAMLNTRGKAGQIDSLEDLFESMKQSACKPDLITYNTVMNSYVRAGMGLGTVVDVFRDMYSQGIDPDLVSFDTLLQACIPGRHVKEAQKIFDNLKKKGLKPSVVTYTTLITLYANSGHCTQALEVLSDMVAENCRPNTRTFSSLITACGREGNTEEAERLFLAMREFGVEPNVVTYNAMIDMYGKGGNLEMALQKFKELELAGLKPTDVTFSSLMSCLKAAGAYEEVISFYHRAKMESVCNQHVFSEAIDTCIKWGKLQKVKDVQSDMVAVNCSPNIFICSIVLAALGSKCSSAEDATVLVDFLQGFGSDLAVDSCRLLLKQMSSDEEVLSNISRLFSFLDKEDLKTWTVFTGALVDALWALGWYRRAALVVAWVMRKGLFEDICVTGPREWKLDLRRLSSGTALLALYQWFGHLVIIARHFETLKITNLRPELNPPLTSNKEDPVGEVSNKLSGDVERSMPVQVELLLPLFPALSEPMASEFLQEPAGYEFGTEFPPLITIVTGWGKLSKQEGSSIIKSVVQKEILKLRAPFKSSLDSGRWITTGSLLIPWLMSPTTATRLALSDLAAERHVVPLVLSTSVVWLPKPADDVISSPSWIYIEH